jgi:ketosteroid isomerase-like protein
MRIDMAPPDTSSSALQALLKRLWIHGFLAGVGVLCVLLLISYFIWGWPFATSEGPEEINPTPPQTLVAPTTPATPVETPPPPGAAVGPPAALKAELSSVLARLQAATQKRDLQQLLSLYSPSFPDLSQKAREISRSWASYDYLSLNFKLTEIKTPAPDNATALVTWTIKTREHQTQKIQDLTRVYLVSFTRESGQWRIKSLEKVE